MFKPTKNEITRLLVNKENDLPTDDFRILDSWAEYENPDSTDFSNRPLKYLCYKLEMINPESGEKSIIFKALKFARVIRLPKDAKQSTALMDMHEQILSAAYENRMFFVTILANIIHPVPLGLLFLYGVQGVGDDIEIAKDIADQDFAGLIATLQGTYKVLHTRIINCQESEWLREKLFDMNYMTMVRGLPKANKTGENAGNKDFGSKNVNPNSQSTIEEFVAGMTSYEYIVQVVVAPIDVKVLEHYQVENQKQMTYWNGLKQGSKNFSAGLSLPMVFTANNSNSSGWNHSYSDAESMNYGVSDTYGSNMGQSIGDSISHSLGESNSQSLGTSHSANQGSSASVNGGDSASNSYGENSGHSTSQNTGVNEGFNTGSSHGHSVGVSEGNSHSFGNSESANSGYNQSYSKTDGVSQSTSKSVSSGHSSSASDGTSGSHGTNQSNGLTYNNSLSGNNGDGSNLGFNAGGGSLGHSENSSMGVTRGDGGSYSGGESTSDGWSQGHSNSVNYGESASGSLGHTSSVGSSEGTSMSHGQSVSENIGTSSSMSSSDNVGQSSGHSVGTSYGEGASQNFGQSVGASNGHTSGASLGSSNGVSVGNTAGISRGTSSGISSGQTYGQSAGSSISKGMSQGTALNTGMAAGSSGTVSSGTGGSMGLGPSVSYSKQYQWADQQVIDLLELMEFQNERIKNALRGCGAFHTYVSIACEDKLGLAAAKALAKSTWQNENAMIMPLQVIELSPQEQKHLLYHMAAFSTDVTKEEVEGVRQYKYSTVLLPRELVAYTHLPRISEGGIYSEAEDIPMGFAVPSMKKGEIYMGTVISPQRYDFKKGYMTNFDYRVSEDELMHGIFTGASRSGKTVGAMRFIAELSRVRRKATKKRLRIVCLDPKQDWRGLARFVEPERFNFYSLARPDFHGLKFNPCKIPKGVRPQVWIDCLIEIYCRSYGLLERGKQMLADVIYDLYDKAGVFEAENNPGWETVVPQLSSKVTFSSIYDKMVQYKLSMEDGSSSKGRSGNDTKDAYARLIERLSAFGRKISIEYKLFGTDEGIGIDELIGQDDVTVLESKGLEKTFKNFIFGIITAGFYRYAIANEGGYLAPDQYETVLVIEEANEVLTGSKGNDVQLAGQSEFEEILDQSAGYGLFIFSITQQLSQIPKSIVANSGLMFSTRLSMEDDAEMFISKIARNKLDDRDILKWTRRMPKGWCICQSSRTNDFLDCEPVLVKIAMLNVSHPSDNEIDEILINKKISKEIKIAANM